MIKYCLLVGALHVLGIAQCFVDITLVDYKSINAVLHMRIRVLNVGLPAGRWQNLSQNQVSDCKAFYLTFSGKQLSN